METWKKILRKSITAPDQLGPKIAGDTGPLAAVTKIFPMRINPYFYGLIETRKDPIARQCIPDTLELEDRVCTPDPLAEEQLSPVPNLVHKYPNRVLLLVCNQCAVYCRFCTRKRKVGKSQFKTGPNRLAQAYDYIRKHPEVSDVLVSGGDPLLLEDNQIDEILYNLRSIPSVKIIRIGTRIPSTLPMRVTEGLVDILKRHHPLFINTHFNHPKEITPEAERACALLANAGIPLGSQTVLLKGINDDLAVLKELMQKLLFMRVKPYYLFQSDTTYGVDHFRTKTKTGIELMRGLYGHLSGMAIPTLALDAPGGMGKIPLTPQFITESTDSSLCFNNYLGKKCSYPEPVDPG
ncbi:MAG: lysine 2,3-aminomutase [Deltaproteobacteria bacterium]|nr:MAG: lysine 2,3-aminomutase [Deltaproteobacteria bacterium]